MRCCNTQNKADAQNSWRTWILGQHSLSWCPHKHESTSEVRLRHCWLRHDDKFHFQLTFFRDVINETFIRLRLTHITFPWIHANRGHFKKYISTCIINFSPSAQKPSQDQPRLDSWLDEKLSKTEKTNWMQGKIMNCLAKWKVLMGDSTDSLQRKLPTLPETWCFRQHLSACSASPLTGNGALDA